MAQRNQIKTDCHKNTDAMVFAIFTSLLMIIKDQYVINKNT